MSQYNIIDSPARVWAFLREQGVAVPVIGGMRALGLERDGQLVMGVLYEGFNGVNVWMHVALAPGARMTRKFLRYAFFYPFVALGCKRVSGYVEASNEKARAFDEHIGFRPEAVLKGAATDGGDVVLYVMRREECKYVDTK